MIWFYHAPMELQREYRVKINPVELSQLLGMTVFHKRMSDTGEWIVSFDDVELQRSNFAQLLQPFVAQPRS